MLRVSNGLHKMFPSRNLSSQHTPLIESHIAPSFSTWQTLLLKTNTKSTLSLSKAQYLEAYASASGDPYDKLVVRAIIFDPKSIDSKILLIKRAAHETILPNMFKVAGSKVDNSDTTILDGLKREVMEETAMKIQNVNEIAESFCYAIEKTIKQGKVEEFVQKTSLHLYFFCEVADAIFRVDPSEHSEGLWATRDEVLGLGMTEEMRFVVEDAFKWE